MKPKSLLRSILWVIILSLSLFGRLLADGFPLPLHNAGTWGTAPAALVGDIERALKDSGFLKAVETAGGIAQGLTTGKVPAIDDLAGIVEGDVKDRVHDAVVQASDATRLLAMVDVTSLQRLFATLQSGITTPQQFAFTIPGGRLVVRRDLADVSLCAMIAGPSGGRVTLGMSNGKQLCGNPAERFFNPTREPQLFADIALGLSHLQARRKLLAIPVLGPDPAVSIQAATYFKIHDDWVQLRLAGNDPQALTLKLQFVVGVKAGISAEIQAEVEGQVILELEVKPTQVANLLFDIGDILRKRLGEGSHASIGAAPELAAAAFHEVFVHLQTLKDRGEELGAITVRLAGDGGVGVGIWDTGINGASVGAELTLSVPLEAVVTLQTDLLAAQFKAGLAASTQLISLFEAMSEGRLTDRELKRQLELLGRTSTQFGSGILNSYSNYVQNIVLELEMGVYGLGDIGQVADQTIPLIVLGAEVPVGKILVDGINGIPRFVGGITETAKAMAWLAETAITAGLNSGDSLSLGKIVPLPAKPGGYIQRPRGQPPIPPTPAEWEAMAATLLDDVTFSVQFGIIRVEGASLGNLVRLAAGASEVTSSLLVGAIRSAVESNEKPFLDALRAAPGKAGNRAQDILIFNLQNLAISTKGTLGASGTIGLEGTVGVGAEIGFEGRVKASLILLALKSADYDEPDGTVLAGIDFPMELSASAGLQLGEGVEVTVEGGVTAGVSLANLTLKDWGQELPVPAGLTVAGFEVIDFTGVKRQDGSIDGNGWIVLPMGGLVRADAFSLDPAGKLLSGRWSGVLELGPLGEVPYINGAITTGGLVGSFDRVLGSSTLKTDFLLQSNGLLFGTAKGHLRVGELTLGIDLKLDAQGFYGNGTTYILGSEFRTTNLRIQPNGRITGSFTGSVVVEGQSLTFHQLEILDDRLEGRTTLDVAGQKAVELLVTVGRGGVIGSFVSDLNVFGRGRAEAWVRLTDTIEVFGEMDRDFAANLASLLRTQVVGLLGDVQEQLRREREKQEQHRKKMEQLDQILAALPNQILEEKKATLGAVQEAATQAQQLLRSANEELDKAIDALLAVSGTLSADLTRAQNAFRGTASAFSFAQGRLGGIDRDIGILDRWYNGLNPVDKAFHFIGYHSARGAMLLARDAAVKALGVARVAFNEADADLRKVQNDLARHDEQLRNKAAKEQLVAIAEDRANKAERDLQDLLKILADPRIDPLYIANQLALDAVRQLSRESEALIQQFVAKLNEAAGLIDFIQQQGELMVLRVDRVHFHSKLAQLNRGIVELVVDALVAGQPRRLVFSYDFATGRNEAPIAAATRAIYPQVHPNTSWSIQPWSDDATSGLSTRRTLWAYHFNSDAAATVNSVPVTGLTGASPAVPGRFSVQGYPHTFTADQNHLTQASDGSALLAANFLWGANPGLVTLEGLTPGKTYRATFFSVGWDDAPVVRNNTFSNATEGFTVEQNAFGNNQGIRIEYTFVANEPSHSVTLHPQEGNTFHLYALALSSDTVSRLTSGDWKVAQFGSNAFNPVVSADGADPDGDGIVNYAEYALRSNPQASNPSPFTLPKTVRLPDGTEARQFVIPFQPTAGDVVYRIRRSTDLGAWTEVFRLDLAAGTSSQFPGLTGIADPMSQTLTVTVTDLSLFDHHSFWTLAVEKR